MIIVVDYKSFAFDRYNMAIIKDSEGYYSLCLYEKASPYNNKDRIIIDTSTNEYAMIDKFDEIVFAYEKGDKVFRAK